VSAPISASVAVPKDASYTCDVRRFVAVLLTVLVVAAAAVAAYVWQRLQPPRIPPLEPNWQATVAVLAGDGVPGTIDGEAWRARFSEPFGIAAAPDGTIFVTDAGQAHEVRRISPDGRVSTVAGGFSTPSGLALAPDGTLYLADTGNHAIRRITPDRQIATVAGDGIPGYVDGPAHQARFNGPIGIAVARDGRIFVADTYNDRIRVIDVNGTVSTLAGSGRPGADDGVAEQASFDTPSGVAIDARGTLYVADTGNDMLRIVDQAGRVTTPAWAHGAGFFRPIGIAVGPSAFAEATAGKDRELYVTDEGGRIVAIRPDGGIRTLAGGGVGFVDGKGTRAQFRRPSGVALLRPGHLVVADAANALVRVVAATSQVGLQPPTSPAIRPRFDAEAFGVVPLLWPVAPASGPHEIAGSFGEVRGDRQERFHRGIDVRVEQGTPVYAVRDGIVSSPISNDGVDALDEWLRIGNLTYVHIRAGRTRRALLDSSRFVANYDGRKLIRLRVKRGARFAAGDLIGTVNRFNHVHMNVGWSGEEHNPLLFRLVRFEDTVIPTIPADGIRVYDEAWSLQTRRVQKRLLLAGRVRVVIDAWDQADDNVPTRRLAPYELGYQVLNVDGSPAIGFETRRPSLRFDRVGLSPDAPPMVYGAGSGIPFYGGRRTRYLYIVTNRLEGGQTAEGFWDTDRMNPGNYILRGWAADVSGNVVVRDLPVTIGVTD
jgi:sugar lactone lactonase YvrE/murein DD-endopeptidase MepM/ murein hydrolase activator NlpD